ncbi:MAG TPA: hypothetical protein VJM84_03985 [Actinomycetota bacterium]|nr:hypothetical protein [Actinomycetota bacterium]
MSRVLRLLIALAIAAPVVISMAAPAVACSCAPLSPDKILKQADAVVAGHVVDEQPVDPMNTHSTLAVDGVYKGDVEATITLTAEIGSDWVSSCAVLYPVGSTVDPLVLERLDDGTYRISACAFLSRVQVLKLAGDARPPPPASETPSAVASPLPATEDDAGLNWPAVGGGLALAVVAIALVLHRSGRRNQGEDPSPFDQIEATPHDPSG